MQKWCHQPTNIKYRNVLQYAVLIMIFVALFTTLIFTSTSQASQSTNRTIGFQGRLTNPSGAVVPDGYYNMAFRIYEGGSGSVAANPDGTLKWAESRFTGDGNGVRVKNGYFSVDLGSVYPFGSNVNWNHDTLWLSMEIAGKSTSCSNANIEACEFDGEMLPMKRITATPYAINAGAVGGKTADNFVQLGQGVQTDASTNTSSIHINKTSSSGDLVRLQRSSIDVFTIGNTGNLTLGNNTDKLITVAKSPDNAAGRSLTVSAGDGGDGDSGSSGGTLVLQGGSAAGGGAVGGGAGNSIALVVVNPSSLTLVEQAVKNHLEGLPVEGGVTVTPHLQSVAVPEDGSYDVIVVTEDVSGSVMATVPEYRTSTIPIVTFENGNLTPLNLATSSGSGSTTAYLQSMDPHPINDNAPPGTTVYPFPGGRASRTVPVSHLAPAATKIYNHNNNTSAAIAFAYDTGDIGTEGFQMPARRVFIGINATSMLDFTADGLAMFDRAVMWAANNFENGNGGGDGGSVMIDAGIHTGTGSAGMIGIGVANASKIQIGSTTTAIHQEINIGTNNTAGSSTNVTIGAGESADEGSTTIQAKNAVTIKTNGTTRATFSDTANTVYFGNGVTSSAPNDYTLQGTGSSTGGVAGGSLTVQGGDATAGDTNGGNVVLRGGVGSGSGASGLVVINTPTFSTTVNDTNCYVGGSIVDSSCTISQASVDDSAAAIVGFSATEQTATLPDPTIKTAGRIFYVIAAGDSETFTLSINGGGPSSQYTMRPDTALTLIWNGSDWVNASGNSQDLEEPMAIQGGEIMTLDSNDDDLKVITTPETETGQTLPTPDSTETTAAETSNDENSNQPFRLDNSDSAPGGDDEALLGSMYYDTHLGKVQCYEREGWGDCGASPDTFITISPEYSNAVMNGADIGTITSDICSDSLNINNGNDDEVAICGENETYNFYNWTSEEEEAQTRSIFVTHQLPANFDNFVADSTSLLGRTDSDNAEVSYQIYRDSQDGLQSCGPLVTVSSGSKSSWQQGSAPSGADPADCEFKPGDSILFRINLTASSNANAYVSNLSFIYSNK